jgi:hypothetical protein
MNPLDFGKHVKLGSRVYRPPTSIVILSAAKRFACESIRGVEGSLPRRSLQKHCIPGITPSK